MSLVQWGEQEDNVGRDGQDGVVCRGRSDGQNINNGAN